MKVIDVKIEVFTKDKSSENNDDAYLAIVMGWDGDIWFNTGIVVRSSSPTNAFEKALSRAKEHGWFI